MKTINHNTTANGSIQKQAGTAVIYLRAACREQAVCRPQVPSTVAQHHMCRKAAEQANLKVVDCFADYGTKGRLAQRPGLRGLLHYAAKHHPDYLIVANDSRLGRNVDDLTEILSQLAEANIKLLVANDPSGALEDIHSKLLTMRRMIQSQAHNAAPDPLDDI